MNRVDLYQLQQIFEAEKGMPLVQAVTEASRGFGIQLHSFGQPYHAVPKEAAYRQLKLYNRKIPGLIKNFSNLSGVFHGCDPVVLKPLISLLIATWFVY